MIEVSNLTKVYGDNIAVNDISFSAEKGKVYGFLGPNGAGKSTTMNIIAGCIPATRGQVVIDGYDIYTAPEQAKRRIGYLPERPPLYPEMTPEEYLAFVAEAKGISKNNIRKAIDDVIERTKILDMRRRLIRHLSKGYKQRVGLAQAILASPSIVILDEPTAGFDPQQLIEARKLIRELAEGAAVIFSSHILFEVSEVCDEMMIISHGKMIVKDSAERLSHRLAGTNSLRLTVRAGEQEITKALQMQGINDMRIEKSIEHGCEEVYIASQSNKDIREQVYFALSQAGIPLRSMVADRASLEKVFVELTSDDHIHRRVGNEEA